MANEKRLIDHKEYARQMRTHAVADAGVIRVSTELWEQIADIIENSVEVVHGHWDLYFYGKELQCSVCKATFWDEEQNGGTNYCPNCGAKMDGGNEDV